MLNQELSAQSEQYKTDKAPKAAESECAAVYKHPLNNYPIFTGDGVGSSQDYRAATKENSVADWLNVQPDRDSNPVD